jgi:hypothetical protein
MLATAKMEAQLAQSHIDLDATLKAQQERLTSRRQELEADREEIEQRLRRIAAYFGNASAPSQIKRPPRGNRHPRGFVQATVLKSITGHPQGMTSAENYRGAGSFPGYPASNQ